jgi:hypothetical protein
MITENIIKTEFVLDALKHQTNIFYKREIDRFGKYLHSKSGSTLKSLLTPDYRITASEEDFQVVAKITKQLRFQDFGLRKLYTKPMHAVFLGRVKNRLQYGLTEEIREKIVNELQQSMES